MSGDRLDHVLVARGLAPSRARAQALIRAGAVTVAGRTATRPALRVGEAEVAVAPDPNPWVSRAGLKLAHALDVFDLDPAGAVALDVGASTGGFTEVLLARGAAQVHALDVGRGQLHPRLRADPRVTVHEGLNARDLGAEVPEVDWIVADVSFISLAKALPRPLARARPGATLVALVKPQFELSPAEIGKGGIVRDDAARARAADTVAAFLKGAGWEVAGRAESPVAGGDGNREILLAAVRPP